MQPSITHDLFDQINGISSVGLIEEQHCVQLILLVLLCLFNSTLNKGNDVFFCGTTMDLEALNHDICI